MNMNRREFIGAGAFAACGFSLPALAAELRTAAPPNYWCTWDTQAKTLGAHLKSGKVEFAGDQGRPGVRDNLNERVLFGPDGWARTLYAKSRPDLFLVLDDGWDVPYGAQPWKPVEMIHLFSSLVPDGRRFPSLEGTEGAKLKALNDRIRGCGWRGTGLWVACQGSGDQTRAEVDSPALAEQLKRKLGWCAEAGIGYWKVDWGIHNRHIGFRHLMSELKAKYHPDLVIEHCRGFDNALNGRLGTGKLADGTVDLTGETGRVYGNALYEKATDQTREILTFADTFRTYDVTEPLTTATSIDRGLWAVALADESSSKCVVNIEDEAYVSSCLGLAIGAMRAACWPKPGYATPRDRGVRTAEIDRAVLWQRLAPAFGSDRGVRIRASAETVSETMRFEKDTTWWEAVFGRTVTQTSSARVTRGLPLPEVKPRGAERPFVLASRNPNGTVTVGVLPHITPGRGYHTPEADVALDADLTGAPLGVFGSPASLTLRCAKRGRVRAGDMLGGEAEDVTSACVFAEGGVTVPGAVFARIGRRMNPAGDVSEPGTVLTLS